MVSQCVPNLAQRRSAAGSIKTKTQVYSRLKTQVSQAAEEVRKLSSSTMEAQDIEPAPEKDKNTMATMALMEKGEGEMSMMVVIEAAENSNSDFTEVKEENGAVKYECNMCKKRFTKPGGVKMHITSIHLKKEIRVTGVGKRKSVADVEDDDFKKAKMATEAGFSKSLLEQWENTDLVCSTQLGIEDLYKEYVGNEEEEEMVDGEGENEETPAENDTILVTEEMDQDESSSIKEELQMAKGEIRNLKEQLENKETTISEMEGELKELKESMKTKDDIINWNQGRVNELEVSLMNKNMETETHLRVLNKMNAKIKATSETADVKKHKKEMTTKDKEIEDMNARLSDAMKSVMEERNMRAKAEADLQTMRTVNESMKAVMLVQQQQQQQWPTSQGAATHCLTSQQSNQTFQQEGTRTGDGKGPSRKQTLCRDLNKPGGCRYKERCQFFHPDDNNQASSQPSQEEKPDCSYWMTGHCKVPEERCKGKHDRSKFNTKPRIEKQATRDVNSPDFVQTLVGALSQALTGVQQQVPPARAHSPLPARGQQQPGTPAFTQQQEGQLVLKQPGVPAFRQQHQMNPVLGQQQMMIPQIGQQMIQPAMMMPTLPNLYYPTQQQQWGGQSSSSQ